VFMAPLGVGDVGGAALRAQHAVRARSFPRGSTGLVAQFLLDLRHDRALRHWHAAF